MSVSLNEIEQHLKDEYELIDNIRKDFHGHKQAINRRLDEMNHDTNIALKIAKKGLKRYRELTYAVRENRKDIAIERHRLDGAEREIKRIPETCHIGQAFIEHKAAHNEGREDKKVRISVWALIPGFVAVGVSVLALIMGLAV